MTESPVFAHRLAARTRQTGNPPACRAEGVKTCADDLTCMTRRDATREKVEFRVVDLCDDLDAYADAYDRAGPFSRPEQLATHRATIDRRRHLGGIVEAAGDVEFARSLYSTLEAWNMNQRGARLHEFSAFHAALQEIAPLLKPFESATIERVDGAGMATRLCDWMDKLNIAPTENKVVSATKTLHHLLPDLIPPMDRAYTRVFFEWHMPQFQNNPRGFLLDVYPYLVRIAKASKPERLVGPGWRTSRTKLLDNAIVAYCGAKKLSLA